MKELKLCTLGTVPFISSFGNLNNETCAPDPHYLYNEDPDLGFVLNTDRKPGFDVKTIFHFIFALLELTRWAKMFDFAPSRVNPRFKAVQKSC
jgi:hypothetical protein